MLAHRTDNISNRPFDGLFERLFLFVKQTPKMFVEHMPFFSEGFVCFIKLLFWLTQFTSLVIFILIIYLPRYINLTIDKIINILPKILTCPRHDRLFEVKLFWCKTTTVTNYQIYNFQVFCKMSIYIG